MDSQTREHIERKVFFSSADIISREGSWTSPHQTKLMVKKPEVMRKAPTVRYHIATTIPRCLSEEGEGKITLRLSAVGTTASEL